MRKVKFIQKSKIYYNLTSNKVYDVITCENNIITILDDEGQKDYFYNSINSPMFIDITSEYRCEVIENILE